MTLSPGILVTLRTRSEILKQRWCVICIRRKKKGSPIVFAQVSIALWKHLQKFEKMVGKKSPVTRVPNMCVVRLNFQYFFNNWLNTNSITPRGHWSLLRKRVLFQCTRLQSWGNRCGYWDNPYSETKTSAYNLGRRLDYQPLFGKGARAPPQTRESGGNQAYLGREERKWRFKDELPVTWSNNCLDVVTSDVVFLSSD